MKKFTFMLLTAFIAVAAMAASPEKRVMKPLDKAAVMTSSAKQAMPVAKGISRQATSRKVLRRSMDLVTPPASATPETYYTASGQLNVYSSSSGWVNGGRKSIQVIVDGTDIYIAGLSYGAENAWIKGTVDGATATFPSSQFVDDSEWISGSDDAETLTDIVFNFDQEAGVLACVTAYIGDCAAEDAFSLYAYWDQPTFTKDEPAGPSVVVLPEGLEVLPYVMSYDDGSTPINVAVDGNDVYFQGMSYYVPEAWVKGTKDGNTVTFPEMQYMGEYGNYGSSYFFYNGETVFTYDAETGTYAAEGTIYGVLADSYYDGKYIDPVLSPVVEKAAMPANPVITSMEDSNYGWIVNFNVPLTDIEGEALVASKLSYMIYTDIEGTVSPLTFTPETHTYLKEEMTEIPYGFTENYDFYATYIYLNELYSESWNKIGIQSIYVGGDKLNVTEIQWFDIKPYKSQNCIFNFNAMDVAVSTNDTTDGDITEALEFTEGDVTLAISPKTESATTENRFWSTSAGPQLRVYSGTLTFSVPEDYAITQIVFNHNGKWGANTVEGVKITNDNKNNVATWTGAAQTVVVSIAANTQINSINVTVEAQVDELVVLPEGVETMACALEGFYSDGEDGSDVSRNTEVAVDGTDVYVKGLAYWFENAWLKGTLNAETGIVTFPSGQLVGEDKYGKEFMVGYDNDACDIQYVYDAEALTLTQLTPYVMESSTKTGLNEEGELDIWGMWEFSYFHEGEAAQPVAVEVPEGLETEIHVFNANVLEAGKEEVQPYSFQIQVGVVGQDVYIKGLSDNTADMWLKGTLSLDGSVTIPANQYMGTITSWSSKFDYYFTAVSEDGEFVDVVLNYNPETNTLSTEQTLILNGSKFVDYPYQTFTNVVITQMHEFAAIPADPSFDGYKFQDTSYPYVSLAIPTKDVEGNEILTSKLFYIIWVETDGNVRPFEVQTNEYKYVEENWTEIPYEWDDNYDIYKAGSKFYFNPTDEVAYLKNIGVQSVYYGGGERNTSNIVWMENPVYDADAIVSVLEETEERAIYNLSGQRLNKKQKGINIIGGKKVMVK